MLQALHNCFGVYLAAQARVAESLVQRNPLSMNSWMTKALRSTCDSKVQKGWLPVKVKTNLPKARPKIDAAIKIKTRLDSKLEWRTFERTCPRIGWSIAWGRFFVKIDVVINKRTSWMSLQCPIRWRLYSQAVANTG